MHTYYIVNILTINDDSYLWELHPLSVPLPGHFSSVYVSYIMEYSKFFEYSMRRLEQCGYFLKYDKISTRKRLYQILYTFVWITYIIIIFIPTEIMTLILNASDLNNFIRVLCDCSNHFEGMYKTYVWFKYRNQIALIMKELSDDTIFCEEEFEDFKPRKILLKHRMRSEKWIKFFFTSVNILVTFMLLTRLYAILFQFEYLKNGSFKSFPPFGDSQIRAIGQLVFQIIPLTAWAWTVVGRYYIISNSVTHIKFKYLLK